MAKFLVGTDWVDEDEPCFELYEQDVQAPDNSGVRRYLVYRVMRNGRVAEFREDKGSATDFKDDPLVILGGVILNGKMEILETVGSLREIADQYRNHVHLDKKELVGVDNIRLR